MNLETKTNIVLIGFMGTGKTATGKLLAERLGKRFVDLDTLIERKASKTIPEIFQDEGEIAFRELEIAAVKEAAAGTNLVIACGGGVILNQINISRLQLTSTIVCLTATPKVIVKRISGDETRPLMNVQDKAARIKELLQNRRFLYKSATDIIVSTSRLSIEQVVEEVSRKIEGK